MTSSRINKLLKAAGSKFSSFSDFIHMNEIDFMNIAKRPLFPKKLVNWVNNRFFGRNIRPATLIS